MKKKIAELYSKEYKYWVDIKDKTKTEIEQLENMLKFNRAILAMAEQKIKKERRGGLTKIFQ